jgi:hypothetical protein
MLGYPAQSKSIQQASLIALDGVALDDVCVKLRSSKFIPAPYFFAKEDMHSHFATRLQSSTAVLLPRAKRSSVKHTAIAQMHADCCSLKKHTVAHSSTLFPIQAHYRSLKHTAIAPMP